MERTKKIENIKNISRIVRCKKALNFGKVFQERGLIRPVSFAGLILTIVIIFLIFPVNVLATAWDISTAEYAEKSKDVSAQDALPYGVAFNLDGDKMYIMGFDNRRVYQYTLSTAWDISTATYAEKYAAVGAQDSWPVYVTFSSDGSKMYIMGWLNDTVYQYTLSTGWDVSTANYDEKYKLVSDQDTTPRSIAFNPDGTKMYIVGDTNDTVYQYTLSAGWDVSTATYATKLKDLSTQDVSPRGIAFNPDGDKMYISGTDTDTVYQYTLSTGWDVSTAVYAEKSKLVSAQDTSPLGLAFSSAGAKMYIMGYDNDTVYQYTLPAPAPPTVTIQAVTSIEATTATGNGNITDTGGEDCDKRGFVYDTSAKSKPGNVAPGASGYANYAEDTDGFGTGAFTKGLTGLTPGTKYYIRAYAHNSAGYNYSDTELEFTTTKITYYAKRSTSVNDDSSWRAETEIGRDSSGFGHMSLVPMGSNQVMAIYNDYDGSNYNLKYRIYDGDGSWGASSTVVADCKDNTSFADWDEYHWFSAVADSLNNVHLIYVDSNDNDLNYTYYSDSSWSSAQEIYTGTVTHPSLSYDSTSENLVAFFIEGNAVKYKVKSSGSWGDPSGGAVVKTGLDSPSYLGSAYSDATSIGVIWRERSSSPYAISYAILTLSEARSDIIRIKGGVRLKGGLRLK